MRIRKIITGNLIAALTAACIWPAAAPVHAAAAGSGLQPGEASLQGETEPAGGDFGQKAAAGSGPETSVAAVIAQFAEDLPEEDSYDGWLVAVETPDGAETPASAETSSVRKAQGASAGLKADAVRIAGIEQLTEEVFLADDLAAVSDLVETGTVTAVEPNYVIDLFAGEDTEEDAGSDTGSDTGGNACEETGGDTGSDIGGNACEETGGDTGTDTGEEPAVTVTNGWAYEAMLTDHARDLGLTGSGVRIAVIDSGLDTADADLENAVIAEGYNVIDDSTDVTDNIGHGTIVTAMIAGDADDTGVTGIAPGAEILPIKMMETGRTTHLSDMLKAVNYAVSAGADIINMSFGYRADQMTSSADLGNHSVMETTLQAAADRGIVLVAAAGNVSTAYPQGSLVYPAAFDCVIGVGSVDSDKAAYSNTQHTEAVYIVAPGRYVYYKDSARSGTSFACPCAAGAAALLLEQHPELVSADVMKNFRQRAEDLGTAGYDTDYGYGFLRLDRILHSDHVYESRVLAEPSCTEDGLQADVCAECGDVQNETALPAEGHAYETQSIQKATLTADGSITRFCGKCGDTVTETVSRPADLSLKYTVATYSGKAKKPAVTVIDVNGQKIDPQFYKITWPDGRIDVGTYTVTVTMKSPYSGKKKLSFIIRPMPSPIRKLTGGSGRIRVVWTRQAVQTTGYQIQLARNAAFTKDKKTITLRDPQQIAKTVTGLAKGRTYYVRVRTFLKTGARNYYSAWGGYQKVKTTQ